jgi:type IV pilus assembly protein PilA
MNTIKCQNCGLVNWSSLTTCKRCGIAFACSDGTAHVSNEFVQPFTTEPASETSQYTPRNNYTTHRAQSHSSQKKGLAIFALISGLLAMPPISTFGIAIVMGLLVVLLGTAGLVVSSILFLLLLPSGLVTGIISLNRANKKPLEYGGKGFAIAGIALSAFSMVTIPIVAAIAIPNLLASRRAANEGTAVSTLKTIRAMQAEFMAANGQCSEIDMLEWNKSPQYAAANVKSGYQFTLSKSQNGPCEINAVPVVARGVSSTGIRSFFMSSEDGWTIRAADNGGRPATIQSSPIGTEQISQQRKH